VGNAPPAVRRQFDAYENVVLTGRIEHIRDGMVDAFCAVCPLRAAAGIQNKMLEYFALGLPCVTSQLGLGGVEARQGEEVLVFQNASEAAEQILALHGDRAMRMKLAHAARRLVESRYQWAGLYEAFRISAENVRANANRRTDGKDGITAAA
jgi:glycosyltransferase involved in cell wall biosynthesis